MDDACAYECTSSTILFASEKARCVSYVECYYGSPKGVIYGDMCIARQEWLDKDQRNYVTQHCDDLYGYE